MITLRHTLSTLLLLIAISMHAQSANVQHDSLYQHLINHTPAGFRQIESEAGKRLAHWKLDNIVKLKTIYEAQYELELTEAETGWFEDMAELLAAAFYLEGTPILMQRTGGYDGCDGKKSIEYETLEGKPVTILNFCYGCKGSALGQRFMEVFNSCTKRFIARENKLAKK